MKNIKCRNCFFYRNEWCEKIVDSPDPEKARDCNYFREMTNADLIRAMSDDDLAKILWKAGRNYRSICADPVVDYNEHYEHLIDWLQQPAEEDGNDRES